MPERGIGVVVPTNGGGLGSALTDLVATAVYDTLLDKPGLRERLDKTVAAARERAAQERREVAEAARGAPAGRKPLAHPLAAYAGTYRSPSRGCLELRLDGGALWAAMGTATSVLEVYDGAKDQLRIELTGGGEVVAVRFVGDAAEGLTFLEHEFVKAACPRRRPEGAAGAAPAQRSGSPPAPPPLSAISSSTSPSRRISSPYAPSRRRAGPPRARS